MQIALFVAILLIAISVPAAYASTLQLVTENGNVFSIDYDEILNTWELYHGNSTARTALNGTVLQDIDNLQTQIDDLIAKLNSNSTDTEINKLEERVDDLLTQLNSNSTSTETEIERLGDLIANLTSNSDVAIDRLEQLIANLDNATESEITELNELLDELETELESQIDELEAGTGVGAGALGSSGRLVTIPTEGILSAGVHTVRDTRGTLETPLAYLYTDYDVDWVTLIRDTESYDEYAVPRLGAEYNANPVTNMLTETSTTQTSELNVRGLESHTAWALLLDGTDDISYAGVTNSAGEVLIPRTPNDGVTITRTTSFDSSHALNIPDRGSIRDTIIVTEHGTVNDLHVTITSSSSSYRAQLISPDGTNYQVNTSGGSGSRTYAVDAVGEQINGDWTLIYKSTSGTRTLQDWTLAINHGSTGKIQSISGSGSQYSVQVSPASSGTFGLDLMNVTGIKDSSRKLLDNSLQTGLDEIHDAGGGNLCTGSGFYVCAIERHNPTTEQTSTRNVEYLVTLSEDATNVDASDFVSLRSIVTATPKVQNTAFDVLYNSTSTSRISVNSINTITSAKLILDVSPLNNQYANEWKLNLTAYGGTNMIITDGSTINLKSEGGRHEFDLGEVIGWDPSNGYWTLSVTDESYNDGNGNPEGQINSWSLEFEHGRSSGTVGTVRQDGIDTDKYIVPVTSLYNYNGYMLWLTSSNNIESSHGDSLEEFDPDPHESYNRGSVSIPPTPHVRGITVSSSTSNSVTFQVMFSETVTGVNATDFIVIENGSPESSGPQESIYFNAPNISISSSTVTTVSDTIPISGYSDGVVDVLTLNVDISHTRIGDLEVELVGPDGTKRMVHNNVGGTTADLVASFTPDFAGKPVNGNWTLQVRDNGTTQSYGTINSWSLDFSYEDTPTYDELLEVEADKGTAYTWKDFLPGNYNLRVYPDAVVHITPCASNGIMIDGYNANSACIYNDKDNMLIYKVSAYMRYPVTVDVDLRDIRMTELGKPDVGLGYLDKSYTAGNVAFIPVIPGMQTLEMKIAGSDTVVHFADIAEPVNILSIPYASGNPAVSTTSMFATGTGEVTAYLQLDTSRRGSATYSFDFTDRYNSIYFSSSGAHPNYVDNIRWMGGALRGLYANNWPLIVQDSVRGDGSSSVYVDVNVYRNGVLVASESTSATQSENNANVQAGTPFSGTITTSSSSSNEGISERLVFYAEVGDYIEISITSRSSTSTSNSGLPPTTITGSGVVCSKTVHQCCTGIWRTSHSASVSINSASCPVGYPDLRWAGSPTMPSSAPSAEYSRSGSTTQNQIDSGYIIIVN